MKIAVIGSGYVGLVTGTCFAETGNNVTCIDINENKIKQMKSGIVPIYEPGLDLLFQRNIAEGRLTFTQDLKQGIEGVDIIFLALPTPAGEDGSADLSYILNVAEKLGPLLNKYVVIVDKSTVPVGTAENVRAKIALSAQVEFDVVSNPEFLREGVAIEDFMKPDRVVIGTQSDKVKALMDVLYAPFVRQGNPILYMDERSAELTKYAGNAFLALKISFMNEMANLSELLGANIDHVRLGIGTDSRIGKRFLFPGIGYGGSCFPKDVSALAKMAVTVDYDFKILKSVMEVNSIQKKVLLQKINKYFDNHLYGKSFAIWGLSFKPNTDDIREAPSLEIIQSLLEQGAHVIVFDPEAMRHIESVFGNTIQYAPNPYDALPNTDALLILTEWSEFRTPDFERIKNTMKETVLFDGRNMYDPHYMFINGWKTTYFKKH